MSDYQPYGVTQNADAAAVTANELVGERAGSVTDNQTNPAFGPARFSTAPYKRPEPDPPPDPLAAAEPEPEPEPEPVATGPYCKFKNCRQPPAEGFGYCDRHTLLKADL